MYRRVSVCCSILSESAKKAAHTPYGGVAQLGEHLPCKQGVMGSNPIISSREAPTGELAWRKLWTKVQHPRVKLEKRLT